jgi:hypothetical protein
LIYSRALPQENPVDESYQLKILQSFFVSSQPFIIVVPGILAGYTGIFGREIANSRITGTLSGIFSRMASIILLLSLLTELFCGLVHFFTSKNLAEFVMQI